MKDIFFQKILNVVEHRPYMTMVTREGKKAQTIAQICEGEYGELNVTLQTQVGPLHGYDGAETTITLPSPLEIGGLGVIPEFQDDPVERETRSVPLYPGEAGPFLYGDNEVKRIINGESISLADPAMAKTVTLWYEEIWAEMWNTNMDKQSVTVTHDGFSITEIPPHGTSEFFIQIEKPDPGEPQIEWDIGDTHQGIIIRTSRENPVIRVTTAPADDQEIAWAEYKALMWVEQDDLSIKSIGIHVWRVDGAKMDTDEIENLEKAISHSLSFMNSAWCRPKIAIAWEQSWDDSKWWGTWPPVWGSWKPTKPAKRDKSKNWMPIDIGAEKVLEHILRNISEDHYPVVERYVHSTTVMDNGDWMSSVTESVAILERLATDAGFRIERRGLELWNGIAQYLRSKHVDRPNYYIGWGREAERLIESGDPHNYLIKAITEFRNRVTAHWRDDENPANAAWLAQQAIYYVEFVIRAELAPTVPLWDRTRGFHHLPIMDFREESEER